MHTRRIIGTCLAAGATALASAEIPITGMPVPELASFDQLIVDFMEDNDIQSGVLGIMKDGVIVYQRGFGWKDAGQTVPLRHDAVMRVASISKPFTAAAIQNLYATGWVDPNDVVFDLGQPDGGILAYSAFDGSGYVDWTAVPDDRVLDITVDQILSHRSGLPCNSGGCLSDPMFRAVPIADDFNNAGIPTSYPPGAVRSTQWMIGRATALEFDPGSDYAYSNPGFMVLGQVVESVSGMSHIDFVRQNVIGPIDWLPVDEVVYGRTFASDQDAREPWYNDDGIMSENVFDPDGDEVSNPYGGWHHELHFASGAMVVSTTALLHLAENYYVDKDSSAAAGLYGAPTNGVRPDPWRSHGGRLRGTSSWLVQRPDGVNFAVIFNKRLDDAPIFAARDMLIDALDAGGFTWPEQGVDGQWVDFAGAWPGAGSYEVPWGGIAVALAESPAEATVNLKPGATVWTGVINQRIRLRAPLGSAVIGQ